MPDNRPSPIPVVIGFILSAVMHLSLLFPAILFVMRPEPAAPLSRPHEAMAVRPIDLPPPPEEEQVELGMDNEQPSTVAWVGYDEYEEHLARLSEVDQAAFTQDPPPGEPVPPEDAEQPSPETEAPAATDEVTEDLPENEESEEPETSQETMAPEPVAPEAIEELDPIDPNEVGEPVESEEETPQDRTEPETETPAPPADEAPSEAPPVPARSDTPQDQTQAVTWLLHTLDQLTAFSSPLPEEGPPEPAMPDDPQNRTEEPALPQPTTGDSKPIAAETDQARKPTETDGKKVAEQKEPKPPRPAVTPGQPVEPTEGAPSKKESIETSVIDVPPSKWKSGKPVVGQGLELIPSRPKITQYATLRSNPRNIVCEMNFRRNGDCVKPKLIGSTGSREFDEAVYNCLFRWKARGAKIKALKGAEVVTVRIRFIFIDRGD